MVAAGDAHAAHDARDVPLHGAVAWEWPSSKTGVAGEGRGAEGVHMGDTLAACHRGEHHTEDSSPWVRRASFLLVVVVVVVVAWSCDDLGAHGPGGDRDIRGSSHWDLCLVEVAG